MCEEILDPGRTSPIVGVTCRPGSRNPALAVNLVREVVWANVTIYVIEPQQARAMSKILPDALGAYNGAARIWMPGVGEHPDHTWHPLIHDSTGIYGEDALRRLADEFAIKPPGAAELTPSNKRSCRSDRHRRRPSHPKRYCFVSAPAKTSGGCCPISVASATARSSSSPLAPAAGTRPFRRAYTCGAQGPRLDLCPGKRRPVPASSTRPRPAAGGRRRGRPDLLARRRPGQRPSRTPPRPCSECQ